MNTASTEHIIYLEAIIETIVMRLLRKSQSKALFFSVFCILAIFAFSPFAAATACSLLHEQNSLTQDTLRPSIDAWGIEGSVRSGESFSVWANVSDPGSGVLNVSAKILQDDVAYSMPLLEFNSTLYQASIPGLELNHTYEISIVAFDNAENRAESYSREFDLRIDTSITVDPTVTLPVVVGSSVLVLVVLIVFSYVKLERKKENRVLQEGLNDEANSGNFCSFKLSHQL